MVRENKEEAMAKYMIKARCLECSVTRTFVRDPENDVKSLDGKKTIQFAYKCDECGHPIKFRP